MILGHALPNMGPYSVTIRNQICDFSSVLTGREEKPTAPKVVEFSVRRSTYLATDTCGTVEMRLYAFIAALFLGQTAGESKWAERSA